MSLDTKITVPASFLVMKSINTAILGQETVSELNLLHVGLLTTSPIDAIATNTELNQILQKHDDPLQGLDQLKDVKVRIQVDPTVPPIAQKPRRLPTMLQKEVDVELQRQLDLGVLETVKKPPAWSTLCTLSPRRTTKECKSAQI